MAQMKMLLVLALFFILTFAAEGDAAGSAVCKSVHAHENGETCFSTVQEFNLSAEDFLQINPNINCDAIFIGQWLCVDGSVSS